MIASGVRVWALGLALTGLVRPASAAVTIRGSVKLTDDAKGPNERMPSFWPRQENGVVRIAPPLVSPLSEIVVVIDGAAPPASSTATVGVDLQGADLVPRVASVAVGTTVEFRNHDRLAYSLFSPDNASFFAKEETSAGKSRKIRFLAPGVYPVRSDEWPHMEGSILVLGTGCFARPDEKGAFKIEAVPDGPHTLKVFYHDRFIHQQPLEVSGKPLEIVVKLPALPARQGE